MKKPYQYILILIFTLASCASNKTIIYSNTEDNTSYRIYINYKTSSFIFKAETSGVNHNILQGRFTEKNDSIYFIKELEDWMQTDEYKSMYDKIVKEFPVSIHKNQKEILMMRKNFIRISTKN